MRPSTTARAKNAYLITSSLSIPKSEKLSASCVASVNKLFTLLHRASDSFGIEVIISFSPLFA